MEVNVIRFKDSQRVEATVRKANRHSLPSLHDGWRFDFAKHSKTDHSQTYVLTTDEMPNTIEGCLIFRVVNGEPYMAFVEIAPHNQGPMRRFENVAGCLIAFACRLSFIYGKGYFKGWLAFDVQEERKDDEIKLMALYCQKYGAVKWGQTKMVISPEAAENLFNRYFNNSIS